MSTSKISPTDCGRQKLASSFCQSHGAAGRTFLVFPGICGTKAGCIFSGPETKIVLERRISLSYLAINEAVTAEYVMVLASILQGFVIDSVSKSLHKAAVIDRKDSNYSSINCVVLNRKRTKNSRIRSAFSLDDNVNPCVIAIKFRGDLVIGRYFVSVYFSDSKKFSIAIYSSITHFHKGIGCVPAESFLIFIGLKTLFFCASESSVNDISLVKSFSISTFQSENGHETPSIRGAAGGQIRQRQQVHALYTGRGCGTPTSPRQLASPVLGGVNHG